MAKCKKAFKSCVKKARGARGRGKCLGKLNKCRGRRKSKR